MNRSLTLIALLLLMINAEAQLNDDFSDGNLTQNPEWMGDISDFMINAEEELQLSAPAAGSSQIHTGLLLPEIAEWQFYFRMAFAPSATNRLRIYLMLDNTDPALASGYFLEIGENGSSDALRLFRLDAGSATEVGTGPGLFGGDPASARIRIRRDAAGQWELAADLSGGTDFTVLFSASDQTYANSQAQYLGIACFYSETRRDRFYFDDLYAGDLITDTTPPTVLDVMALDASHLRVRFSERLHADVLDNTRYQITPDIGMPSTVVFEDLQESDLLLTLSTDLSSGTEYTLHLSDISDITGNVLDTSILFSYTVFAHPEQYEILINEIMADPSPQIGLPNAEYIELYNTTDKVFSLENSALTVGTQTVLLPEVILPAQGFLVLVDEDNMPLFQDIPLVSGIQLPALTNSGTTLELADDLGNPLHRITYDLQSYQDAARDDGGWSLELINPLAPCSISGNLHASQDLSGGTPGRQNSVTQDPVADIDGPILLRVVPTSASSVDLMFDEILSEEGYAISLSPDPVISGYLIVGNTLTLSFHTALLSSTPYTVTVRTISDCLGNIREDQQLSLGLPEPAGPDDVRINEILFNPGTGGSRFIEVINTSFSKFIDLSELVIADIRGDTVAAFPVGTSFLLYPGDVAALTPNVGDIRMRYPMHDPAKLVETEIPAFDRSAGNATIYTRSGVVLDAFDYSEAMHNPLLEDTRGVSLERVSATLPTPARETWYSAAGSVGFATPGLPNSQMLPNITGEGIIEIEPETFSPDGDGFDDFLTVQFLSPPPGAVANVRIFDTQGREIIQLAQNISIGSGSVLRWEGETREGERVRIGPHVIWIELIRGDGSVEHYKRTCVVAEKL